MFLNPENLLGANKSLICTNCKHPRHSIRDSLFTETHRIGKLASILKHIFVHCSHRSHLLPSVVRGTRATSKLIPTTTGATQFRQYRPQIRNYSPTSKSKLREIS